MNQEEMQIQKDAMILIERLFRKNYKDFLVLLLDSKKNVIPWGVVYHTPNGGGRSGKTGSDLKQMGTKSGIPDLILPIPNKDHPALWIEIKRPNGGKLSHNQKQWRSFAHQVNIEYHELTSAKDILEAVKEYMRGVV